MFQESLVESTTLLQNQNRWPALLSVLVQATVAAVIVVVPLLHPELLPMHAPTASLVPPPPPRPPQPPPPVPRVRAAAAVTKTPLMTLATATQHALFPTLRSTTLSITDTPIPNMTAVHMTDNSAALSDLARTSVPAHVTMSSAPPASHTGRINLSSGVTAGMLLAPIHPEYPSIAQAARLEGTVVVRAIISRTGQIERAEAMSGPIMLQGAALMAVEHARYKPYLLNGQPTEVETTVTINFRLGS